MSEVCVKFHRNVLGRIEIDQKERRQQRTLRNSVLKSGGLKETQGLTCIADAGPSDLVTIWRSVAVCKAASLASAVEPCVPLSRALEREVLGDDAEPSARTWEWANAIDVA